MITRNDKLRHIPDWQRELSGAITQLDDLLEIIGLTAKQLNISDAAKKQFSLKVPRHFVNQIQKSCPDDPLLRQILPAAAEMQAHENFIKDPVSDQSFLVSAGVLQKYHGRALMITTGACAIHCRYCFRRHFPYSQNRACDDDWQDAIDYFKQNTNLHEVILSGGDPLTLSDSRLNRLIRKIEQIRHITTLRIHTRLPVVLPQRICPELLSWITNSRLNIVFVIHCNHANEIDPDVTHALQTLRDNNVTLLNQSVLLKQVNDDAQVLSHLSKQLFAAGVLPYYLHLLDPVEGAGHFNVAQADAIQLMRQLRHQLPGYLVPRLVQEQPGKDSKTPLY